METAHPKNSNVPTINVSIQRWLVTAIMTAEMPVTRSDAPSTMVRRVIPTQTTADANTRALTLPADITAAVGMVSNQIPAIPSTASISTNAKATIHALNCVSTLKDRTSVVVWTLTRTMWWLAR
jgi:hypothetical protein